jgi:hypothetical protein
MYVQMHLVMVPVTGKERDWVMVILFVFEVPASAALRSCSWTLQIVDVCRSHLHLLDVVDQQLDLVQEELNNEKVKKKVQLTSFVI